MDRPAVAIIDDYQRNALALADWSAVAARADLTTFDRPWRDEDATATSLAAFDVVVLMRERTPFPARLIARLPRLKMIAMTGFRTSTLDAKACRARGITVCHTTNPNSYAAAELAVGLMLAGLRAIPAGDANMHRGGWQEGLPIGLPLHGKRLGIVGLGKLGTRVARVGKAFDMDVVAWSAELDALSDAEAARLEVRRVGKAELFSTSDVVSLHLVLSARSRHTVTRRELEAMKPGALLVNAARGPLVDEAALLDVLRQGRIRACFDVYDTEPLPADHPLRALPNVILTPHLGFVVADVYAHYYRESVENILAWLDGHPIRVFEE